MQKYVTRAQLEVKKMKNLLTAETKRAEEANARAAVLEESLKIARAELESTKQEAATVK